jgi:hypothetical protein
MIVHGSRGEGGSMKPELFLSTIATATRSRMEAFELSFLLEGNVSHPARFSWVT